MIAYSIVVLVTVIALSMFVFALDFLFSKLVVRLFGAITEAMIPAKGASPAHLRERDPRRMLSRGSDLLTGPSGETSQSVGG